MVKRKESILF